MARNARWRAESVDPTAPESVLATAGVQAWWPTVVDVAAEEVAMVLGPGEAGGSCGGDAAAFARARVRGGRSLRRDRRDVSR